MNILCLHRQILEEDLERLVEIQQKHERIKKFINTHQLDGVLLSGVANFAWFTAGGDSHVENHNKIGVAFLLITKRKRFLITNNIEADRITSEQLNGIADNFEFVVFDWYDPKGEITAIHKLTKGLQVATDFPRSQLVDMPDDFNALRYEMTESEVDRFRWLSRSTSDVFEASVKTIEPGMSEYDIEAHLAKGLMQQGITPVVILVAGDERNFIYRHPVPTSKKFTRFAKLVCCARKWGLITALTRSIYVGEIPIDLLQKQKAVNYVDSVYYSHTKPGVSVGEIIQIGKKAYEKAGYPDEWKNHHQGGAIGYETREYIAVSSSQNLVNLNQAFAWNPSIHGNKSEDTILVTKEGLEIVTETGNWPSTMVEIDGNVYKRPEILVI